MPLTDTERAEVAALIAEAERRTSCPFRTYFPDKGPLRRELYPKSVQFFEAGRYHRERLFLAANRCLGPSTPVETDRATRRCAEMIGAGRFDVRSWDGATRCTSRAQPVYLKGTGPMYRLYLDNGQFVDCTDGHRLLTVEGWLSVGSIIRRASGLRYWRTTEGSTASCASDDCRDGGPPLVAPGSGRAPLPSRADARRQHHDQDARAGEVGRRFRHSPYAVDGAHESIKDDPARVAALCARFPDPTASLDGIWSPRQRLVFSRFARTSGQQSGVRAGGPYRRGVVVDLSENGFQLACRDSSVVHSESQGHARCEVAAVRPLSWQGFLNAAPYSVLFCPSDTPRLVGGNSILSIVPIGLQPILDFEVPSTHCYESGGLIHHNTGKTQTAAFEVTAHLTGDYPHWWKGRVFEGATQWWAAGDTFETTRDIVQEALCGPRDMVRNGRYSGMIPAHLIIDRAMKSGGVPDCVGTIWVKHREKQHGAHLTSTLELKAYQQGRESFQGTSKHGIWLDEQPPDANESPSGGGTPSGNGDLYTECLLRTATTDGLIIATFTPLRGLTSFLDQYLQTSEMAGVDAEGKATVINSKLGLFGSENAA